MCPKINLLQNKYKYLTRQHNDIKLYGSVDYETFDVKKYTDKFTPYRRLSGKPCGRIYSDPFYAISKFEKETGKDYLPINWKEISIFKKLDYIIRSRYANIVAHKIMNSIQNEPLEHCFVLSKKGKILSHNKGFENYVVDTYSIIKDCYSDSIEHRGNRLIDAGIIIHNHPSESYVSSFSAQDIFHSIANKITSMLIDKNGNRFKFTPKPNIDPNIAEKVAERYNELRSMYKEKLLDRFCELQTKFQENLSLNTDEKQKTFRELTHCAAEVKAVLEENDLSYCNKILASEEFQNYGKFEEYIKPVHSKRS